MLAARAVVAGGGGVVAGAAGVVAGVVAGAVPGAAASVGGGEGMSVMPGSAATDAFGSDSVPERSIAKIWLVTPPITSLTIGSVPRGKRRTPMPKVGMSIVPLPESWMVPAASSQRVTSAVLPRMVNSASEAEIVPDPGSMSWVSCSTRIATGIDASDALRMATRPEPVRLSTEPVVLPAICTVPLRRLAVRGVSSASGMPVRSTS